MKMASIFRIYPPDLLSSETARTNIGYHIMKRKARTNIGKARTNTHLNDHTVILGKLGQILLN